MFNGLTDPMTDVAHPARIYDYFLGGKDNYELDREVGQRSLAAFPSVRLAARANREFMHRTTHFVARQGLRQFLDIGTGIPTEPNLHQVAQSVAPESRVVYVDNDPCVLAHARALLTGTDEGRTAYVQAEATDPTAILAAKELRDTLDLTEPVAVSLIGLLNFIRGDVAEIVSTLLDPLASGSTLTVTHVTTDLDDGPDDPNGIGRVIHVYDQSGIPTAARTRMQVESLFGGMDLIDPGVAMVHRWRPRGIEPPQSLDKQISLWGGVGVKR
ncbi:MULTISPECIES: SAM-dependent methyltransferase [Nocardia]|uniref:S-adenosyl methyltransferase n=1 Tax=Nocardia africana TaxID=134964 RepID=A0A378X7G1_9NOCA|nr:SAM-dependent methyltransferase [Nocardia africana]MCC3317900.1 SAM-dependent methyltransferase [Nocardia africana]SUA48674.1 S-adenosyl methyltransferase [Nocardia africana]